MGNTSPWAATNCRASLLSLDKLQAASVKPQATSFKRQAATFRALNQELAVVLWSRAARELVSVIRYEPCKACIRGEAGGSSQQQKGKICQDLHLSLMIKNLKWRTLLTNMVSLTTRWKWPTMHSPMQVQCLKELGLVHVTAAQPIPGSGTEETSSINTKAPARAGACDKLSRDYLSHVQATSNKQQASSCKLATNRRAVICPIDTSFKLKAAGVKRQALNGPWIK